MIVNGIATTTPFPHRCYSHASERTHHKESCRYLPPVAAAPTCPERRHEMGRRAGPFGVTFKEGECMPHICRRVKRGHASFGSNARRLRLAACNRKGVKIWSLAFKARKWAVLSPIALMMDLQGRLTFSNQPIPLFVRTITSILGFSGSRR